MSPKTVMEAKPKHKHESALCKFQNLPLEVPLWCSRFRIRIRRCPCSSQVTAMTWVRSLRNFRVPWVQLKNKQNQKYPFPAYTGFPSPSECACSPVTGMERAWSTLCSGDWSSIESAAPPDHRAP